MSTGLNKQNIFIKDLYIQDLTERFCLFKAVLYIPPPQKKDVKNSHILLILIEFLR